MQDGRRAGLKLIDLNLLISWFYCAPEGGNYLQIAAEFLGGRMAGSL